VITGIGVDLVEIDRVVRACEKEAFVLRCFTEAELELVHADKKKAADNFAVKEAVAKVLGTGFRGFGPKDIEVLRDGQGKPFVKLYGRAQELAKAQGITAIHISISNTKEFANAFAVGEAEASERMEAKSYERVEDEASEKLEDKCSKKLEDNCSEKLEDKSSEKMEDKSS